MLQDADDQLFSANVYQDVTFGPLNLGLSEEETRERVRDTLKALDIESLAERPTHMLSFGQKKRVAIAGIAAMKPEVLILDEPTAGLDTRGVKNLLDLLEKLFRNGTTLVFATHDLVPRLSLGGRNRGVFRRTGPAPGPHGRHTGRSGIPSTGGG